MKARPIERCDSILFIRRDNIGDLVCTTPAIRAARMKYPEARICVLVNSYNAEVIANNPDINDIYIYEKEKHRGNKSRLSVLTSNAGLMRRIRAQKFDAAIACASSYSPRLARYAFLTGARVRIGYGEKDKSKSRLYYNHPIAAPDGSMHEVEAVMGLLRPLGITGTPPPLSVSPDAVTLARVRKYLEKIPGRAPFIAFHISSRRPENRWPVENFIKLITSLREKFNIRPLVLWSPGAADNPLHPGDDEMAERLNKALHPQPVLFKTKTLSELIAALSLTKMVVCLDGGAMHLTAGLGKPVLTIWGSTDPLRWAPWGVENIILKAETKKARDVTVDEAVKAFTTLKARGIIL